jgi:hypothetical protein
MLANVISALSAPGLAESLSNFAIIFMASGFVAWLGATRLSISPVPQICAARAITSSVDRPLA